jgi:hypothetical protein
VGAAFGLIVFIHSPWTVKLGLAGLVLVLLIKKRRPRQVIREVPAAPVKDTAESLFQDGNVIRQGSEVTNEADPDQTTTASYARPSAGIAPTETEEPSPPNDNIIRALSDTSNEVDPHQVTASYAHPTTGLAHTDAALQVYVSSDEGPVKSQARRIIIAGLIKTAAFKTEDDSLDEALRDIVVTRDADILRAKLQVLSERLTHLAATEADCLEPIRKKVITALHIVQIIAEDQDKQSQVQATETLIKTMDTEDSEIKNAEPSMQNEDVAVDPDPGPDASS